MTDNIATLTREDNEKGHQGLPPPDSWRDGHQYKRNQTPGSGTKQTEVLNGPLTPDLLGEGEEYIMNCRTTFNLKSPETRKRM